MNEILSLLADASLPAISAVLLFMGRAVINHGADWLKLRADSEVRAYLTEGLDRAVAYGQAEARRRLGPITNEAARERLPAMTIEIAAQYATQRWPEALARFGIDAPALDAVLKARLPAPPRPLGG
ncbi:MAG: hypothetical protein K2X84_00810 [Beijerinckiaceae bacterium]|nr:hypothetical protein [Beijerinckiaceae bacterium]